MAENSLWNGKVFNNSTKWVICLWDQGKDAEGKKIWKGKALAPGRRSPFSLDVDGMTALEATVPITGWQAWWWLDRGAEVDLTNSDGSMKATVSSTVGSLHKETFAEINSWNPTIDRSQDVSWGEKIRWRE